MPDEATEHLVGGSTVASEATIEDYYSENRVFPPSEEFARQAVLADPGVYERAATQGPEFWAEQAGALDWFRTWDSVLEWDLPFARWFDGGTLNVSYNCLDRHVAAGHGDKVAFHWEGEPGDTRTITYSQLLVDVSRFANVLRGLGVGRGDRVAVYMPMIPELTVAMLACTRIGAVHSVVFGGFSSDALRDRILDAQARVVVTADGGWRRGTPVALKANVDTAVSGTPCVDHVVVAQRIGGDSPGAPSMTPGRDHWWHELLSGDDAAAGGRPSDRCAPEHMAAEDLLFILYTSGTTAAPKGIMHTTGGYLTQVAYTHRVVFDLHPERDVYWCAADIGWVTGHSYIVYGPLANGATSVMYEGTPDYPDRARWWSVIERYGVTILYAAPTAIRTFMKWGTEYPGRHDLTSLRVLGSVGEPINPEAWMWYSTHIGGGRCPVVDTWWQTETGAMMIAPLPGITTTKPGSATRPLPGIAAEVVDEQGAKVDKGGGYLTLTRPWPAMLRGLYGDPERYRQTYWSRFPGRYFAGDGAKTDEDGYLWLLGRVDDVMNVSGHRISTTEVESALVDHPAVAEAAVVGASDPTSGQAIVAFVTLRADAGGPTDERGQELRAHVATRIGPIARPRTVVFTDELPKTRSGKIMRRLLRDVAEGRMLGDTTTLADPAVVDEIRRLASTSPTDE
ncbi:MAG TPA: acetate--CoA ligase [Acidimicrobiales bacterium]|jgi:acetyl-CoA synthetase|nr:acetate--CoA ligase [Acidimicrobiales bacterium]